MRGWPRHLAAMACAAVLLFLLGDVASHVSAGLTLPYDSRHAHLNSLGEGQPFTRGYQYVADRLRTGDAVVLFASSELVNRKTPFVAHNFLPDRLGIPLVSLGRGYFQSFPEYLLLSSLAPQLNASSRVVILFSPGWINLNRVPPNFFPYYLQDDLVYDTRRHGGDLGDLSGYLHDRSDDLEHLSPALREVMRALPVGPPSRPRRLLAWGSDLLLQARGWSYQWVAALYKLSAWLDGGAPPALPPASEPDWPDLERQAIADETPLMTNNQLWVHDQYFTQYLTDHPHGGASLFGQETHEDVELSYLRRNLELLRKHDAKVLLVILPLNGRVYGDLDRFQPVRPQIHAMADELGVQLYDMWEQTPEIGLMGDGMHIGSLGWVRIDRAIARWAR